MFSAFFLVEILKEQKQWCGPPSPQEGKLIIPSASVLCGLDFKRNLGRPLAKSVKQSVQRNSPLLTTFPPPEVLTLPRSLSERNQLRFNSLNKYVLFVMCQAQCQAGQSGQRGAKDGTSLLEKASGNSLSKESFQRTAGNTDGRRESCHLVGRNQNGPSSGGSTGNRQ